MPKEVFYWEWEDAFQKFGFGDGDCPCHTQDIIGLLEGTGWECSYVDGIHNQHIFEMVRGDIKIEFDGYEDNSVIRNRLPADVVTALDKEFPNEK